MTIFDLIVGDFNVAGAARLALLIFCCSASYIFAICIYRVFFHPYAKYPGPLLAKLTNLYALYHSYKENTHIDILRCHEKYEIFGHGKNFYKGEPYKPSISSTFSTFTSSDKTIHGRKRRIIGQGFSDTALRESQQYVMIHVDKLCTYLFRNDGSAEATNDPNPRDSSWTEPKNVGIWSNYMTMDIVSDLGFGRSYNLLEDPNMRYALAARAGAGRRLGLSFQSPSLFRPGMGSKWLDLSTYIFPSSSSSRQDVISLATQSIKARIDSVTKGTSTRKDIISLFISAVDPETSDKLSQAELIAEGNSLIVAGGGTTSVAISGLFFYLSRNKHAYDKAALEVRSHFASADEIRTGPKLASCSYLHACIDESMRMSPPAPIAYYREAGPGGAQVCGHFIPEGLSAATGIYAIHHNETYFPDPFEYRPERWIPSEQNPPERIQRAKAAFNPFSVGPRNCVASPLANLEIILLAAHVLWLGDFKIADGPVGELGAGGPGMGVGRERVGEFQLYEQFGSTKKGPVLQFRRREVGKVE